MKTQDVVMWLLIGTNIYLIWKLKQVTDAIQSDRVGEIIDKVEPVIDDAINVVNKIKQIIP